MEQMWSPWRSEHVGSWEERRGDEGADGLFERLGRETDRDEQNFVVYRADLVYVVMNLYPYNNGHVMIVPLRRVETYEDLTPEERYEMSDVLAKCLDWIRAALAPEGFNIGINIGAGSGAGIPKHLHLHVVPRWSGDTNFMPVTAGTKVIPEGIRTTYRRIRDQIGEAGSESP
ncbi:MAG: HIT domain-containing protein [Rhodothermales bacterium]|nr:HIT domain-containing protein [Rhodothermales bacterium]